MSPEQLILEALLKFSQQKEKCHLELSREINISELKIKQLYYLEIINNYEYLTFSHFAKILEITKPSVTSIVNQLIKLDCVYKQQCSHDGRIHYVKLSEKGKKIVQFKYLEQQRLAKKIVTILSEDDIRTFVLLVDKIVKS